MRIDEKTNIPLGWIFSIVAFSATLFGVTWRASSWATRMEDAVSHLGSDMSLVKKRLGVEEARIPNPEPGPLPFIGAIDPVGRIINAAEAGEKQNGR